MSLLDFKFIRRLLSPTVINLPLAEGDRVDTALYKLQTQVDVQKEIDGIKTIVSDSGTFVANIQEDTLNIVGGTGITTSISGDILTIETDAGTSTSQRTFAFFAS